jgi:hypothetical protein
VGVAAGAKGVPTRLKKSGPDVVPLRPSLAIHERVESETLIPCCSSALRMASEVAKSRRALASARAWSCWTRSSLLMVAFGGVSSEAVGWLASGSRKKSGPDRLPLRAAKRRK